MKIIKAFRHSDSRSCIGFIDEFNCIKVDFWAGDYGIQFMSANIDLYLDDNDCEEISISSFKIALNVVRDKINIKLDELK